MPRSVCLAYSWSGLAVVSTATATRSSPARSSATWWSTSAAARAPAALEVQPPAVGAHPGDAPALAGDDRAQQVQGRGPVARRRRAPRSAGRSASGRRRRCGSAPHDAVEASGACPRGVPSRARARADVREHARRRRVDRAALHRVDAGVGGAQRRRARARSSCYATSDKAGRRSPAHAAGAVPCGAIGASCEADLATRARARGTAAFDIGPARQRTRARRGSRVRAGRRARRVCS